MASSSFQSKFNELMTKKGITSKKALSVEARKFFVFCLARVQDGNDCPFPDYLVSGFINRSNEVTRLYYALDPITRDAVAYCYANSNEEASELLPEYGDHGYRYAHNERLYKVEDSFLASIKNCTKPNAIVKCNLI